MLSPRSFCSLLVLSLGTVISLDAAAHVSLDYPKSRYSSGTQADQNKLKNGPCGATGDSRTTNASLITTFKPGQQITVKWRETVQHPGYFRIAFDNDGQDFTLPGTTNLGEGVSVLADKITDKTTADYTFDITLPNVECSKCTLQLVQVMTTSPPPFQEGPGKDLYFNCADIVLSASAGAGGTGGAGGASSGGANSGGRTAAGAGGANSGGAGAGGMNSGGASGAPQNQGGTNANGGSGGTSNGGSNGGMASGGSSAGGMVAAQGGSSNTGSGGTTSGGANGSGGALAASGGASSGGKASKPPPNDPAGCSYGVGRESGRSSTLLGLGLLGLVLRARRRRAGQAS